jgi:outer membrane protein TolC
MERVSLDMAVRRALERNPSARVAQAEVRRAEAVVREVRSTSLPTLIGNGTYTRLDNDRVLSGRVIAGVDQLAANLTLSVPLINPKGWAAWSHAEDNVAVVRSSEGEARRQVAYAVARAYLSIVAQRRVLEAMERAMVTAKAHAAFAGQRLAGGVGNRLDVVRAEQEVAVDEAQIQLLIASIVRLREALGVLAGAEGPLEVEDAATLSQPQSLGAALAETDQRTDVAAARARLRAAEHVVRDTWTDYGPLLTAIGQPFYQNPPSLVLPLTGWQAQLVLTLPLYDGGLRYGLMRERKELSEEARIGLEATLRQARSEVRGSFEAMRRADDSLVASREAARLARTAEELATLAYRAGATTNLEVIDAERRARDAETLVAVAEDTARQARLDLLVATGRFP